MPFVISIFVSLLICFSSHTNEFLRECQGMSSDTEPIRGRSKLNDRERRQAALPILIFGNDMVRKDKNIITNFNLIIIIFFFLIFRLNYFTRVNFKIVKMVYHG